MRSGLLTRLKKLEFTLSEQRLGEAALFELLQEAFLRQHPEQLKQAAQAALRRLFPDGDEPTVWTTRQVSQFLKIKNPLQGLSFEEFFQKVQAVNEKY